MSLHPVPFYLFFVSVCFFVDLFVHAVWQSVSCEIIRDLAILLALCLPLNPSILSWILLCLYYI
jgi:hypothetical protein